MRAITDMRDDFKPRDRAGPDHQPRPRWPRRIMWFVAIWAASIALLGLISYGLKLWIGPA